MYDPLPVFPMQSSTQDRHGSGSPVHFPPNLGGKHDPLAQLGTPCLVHRDSTSQTPFDLQLYLHGGLGVSLE